MKNKIKEILNSSLNVQRKKKTGMSKEEEEELIRKQASMFKNDQTLAMLPPDLAKSLSTPTFPASSAQIHSNEHYSINDPRFYDGSITQVLNNPVYNPNAFVSSSAPPPYPHFGQQPPQHNYQNRDDEDIQANDDEGDSENESEEEIKTHPPIRKGPAPPKAFKGK